jgi:serine/threonine protein kinase/tetratricopeptide (TPR) repeat protein
VPLAPGTRIGPHEIVAPLGAGGMGEVYRARDSRLGREVAIKALSAEFARDPDRLARFEREARALAALNHPNIAAIYGFEEADGVPHLILELVEGETLAERLRRGPLSLAEALTVARQVAAAVEAAHERGIVHRDLKPGNVMLSTSGLVKVLDFGLARHDEAGAPPSDLSMTPTRTAQAGQTVAGTILGTAAYMSPEQARGRAVDRRSDVWSFGCVLYECLAGRAPFTGETASDLIARILEREPDWGALPPAAPLRVKDILRRCLRKEADARPRDIRDVRLELDELAAAGSSGISAPRAPSIAVLPFENQSGPDDEYFADGMTDEILNALSHIDGLRVAARSSCFAYKGRREDPRALGEKLDVATVLEGTVRRAGSRLRITVQLAAAAEGRQLWSERYDREITDVFAVQDEIAAAVASRLRVTLHEKKTDEAAPRHGTSSIEAYELFLKGRALQLRRGSYVTEAIDCFERAIALDSDYAEALAWLSDSYRLMGTYGMAPANDVMPKAKAAAQKALALDPTLHEARATLADIATQYERDFETGRALWDEVLASDPENVRARCERALWLIGAGLVSPEEAFDEARRASRAEPHNAWAAAMHAFMLGFASRHEEAVVQAKHAVDLDPGSFIARFLYFQSLAWAGRDEEALALAPALLGMSGRHVWVLEFVALLHGRAGRRDRQLAILAELEGRAGHEFVPYTWLASIAATAGLVDKATEYLFRGVQDRDPILVLLRKLPQTEALRALPRYPEVVPIIWGGLDR